ncbi:MAG: sigma-54 dependent transcriptional regulator [Desulfosalsimonadaceae bacterium]
MATVVVTDDDPVINRLICSALKAEGHECHAAYTLSQGLEAARQSGPDLVFLDLSMPDGNGLAWLKVFMDVSSNPEVVIITGTGSEKSVEEAIRQGAWDYVQKPVSVRSLARLVRQALRYRKDKRAAKEPVALMLPGIIGESQSMYGCLQQVAQAASSSAPCLVYGETGVGKELIARAIHANSPRKNGPFVVVDCASLPETLAGSALFGHRKGAFTGAHADRIGLVESATGGVLFLDEIGELPLDVQKNLLRVLQEQRFRPIGGIKEKTSDFRLLSATHRDLSAMVEERTFREDLLYRIMGQQVSVPPLRERMGDLYLLTSHFLRTLCEREGVPVKGVSPDFIPALKAYDWPGNIRELINCLENTIASAGGKPILYPQDLPSYIRVSIRSGQIAGQGRTAERDAPESRGEPPPAVPDAFPAGLSEPTAVLPAEMPTLKEARKEAMEKVEKAYLEQLLESGEKSVEDLCRTADLSRPHFYALLRKYGLASPKKGGRS